jgi:hypothetical protein
VLALDDASHLEKTTMTDEKLEISRPRLLFWFMLLLGTSTGFFAAMLFLPAILLRFDNG